jgi:hypothetical protein
MPALRRLLACLAALSLLTAAAAGARATFKTGRYSGMTTQDLPIAFKVGRKKVSRFHYTIHQKCTDGHEATEPHNPPDVSARIKHRRFVFDEAQDTKDTLGNPITVRVRITGKLRGGKATGHLIRTVDAHALGICTTGVQTYAARH